MFLIDFHLERHIMIYNVFKPIVLILKQMGFYVKKEINLWNSKKVKHKHLVMS